MKLLRIGLICFCTCIVMASCIKDEAPNAEADITSCKIPSKALIRDPVITNDKVLLYVNDSVDITKQAPEFTLTEGASIVPASGSTRDFSSPQTYTVTSQDGKWKKSYQVEYVFNEMLTVYHFENVKMYNDIDYNTGKTKDFFQIFCDTLQGNEMEWGDGNSGFMIINSDAAATDYPTCQSDSGYVGKCAKLTTRSTGSLGAMFNAPIAAGNLFIGTFEINLTNTAKSTHFGVPFYSTPKELVGYYKYKAGSVFTDSKMNVVTGKKDNFDIYAVFYEVTDDVQYLDGTNSLTSSNIVSIARLTDKMETNQWTRFAIPFQMNNGKSIDQNKLKSGKYNLAIIMSSSIDGANFNGAVGSTLYVDEMQLFYE